MTNFKNIVAAITLTVIIASSATFANAGVLLGDLTPTPRRCTQAPDTKGERVNSGILVGDLTGIVSSRFNRHSSRRVHGNRSSWRNDGPVNCGIVVAG